MRSTTTTLNDDNDDDDNDHNDYDDEGDDVSDSCAVKCIEPEPRRFSDEARSSTFVRKN